MTDPERTPVAPAPPPGEPRYYARLIPVVEALVRGGNARLTEHGRLGSDHGFLPAADGYHAALVQPLDFSLVRAVFDVPDDLWLREEQDVIGDRATSASIIGGCGR